MWYNKDMEKYEKDSVKLGIIMMCFGIIFLIILSVALGVFRIW